MEGQTIKNYIIKTYNETGKKEKRSIENVKNKYL